MKVVVDNCSTSTLHAAETPSPTPVRLTRYGMPGCPMPAALSPHSCPGYLHHAVVVATHNAIVVLPTARATGRPATGAPRGAAHFTHESHTTAADAQRAATTSSTCARLSTQAGIDQTRPPPLTLSPTPTPKASPLGFVRLVLCRLGIASRRLVPQTTCRGTEGEAPPAQKGATRRERIHPGE